MNRLGDLRMTTSVVTTAPIGNTAARLDGIAGVLEMS
jgi:hypothetical protein